jgi:hypothetical protein
MTPFVAGIRSVLGWSRLLHGDGMRGHTNTFVACLAILPGGIAAGASATHAAEVDTQSLDTAGASRCEVHGFLTDPDPKGTNVRGAPRGNALVIGHLAPFIHLTPNDDVGVEVEITGSANGWLLVKQVLHPDDDAATLAKAFRGTGWVSGTLVSTQLGATVLHAVPKREAPVTVNLRNDKKGWGADSYKVTRIHACDGQFVEITAAPPEGKPIHGWSYNPCASQLTTCDRSGPEQ